MAAPFPQHVLESVRSAGDIARVISDYVPLKRAGSRLKGLCPFHREKTPSFSVDPERQLFYCFGCQAGGDVFKFVMLYEKLGFAESVEHLARRFGVVLPASGPSRSDPHERLRRLLQEAELFYGQCRTDPQTGRACRAYLERRGIHEATAKGLGLGYAPDGWEALGAHLAGRGFRADELERAGLAVARKSGSGQYDRFRDRLIFPVRDAAGQTVAFGGRALGDAEPKYINSPETPLYRKGEQLYGLDRAREAIRREGLSIVVEGYLDRIALEQAGFANVVATLGTAFTEAQARLLARYSTRTVVSYDGDSAGAAATARSLDLLLAHGFEVRVVELPSGVDPDDYVKTHGAEAYAELLLRAPDYLQFLISREARTRDLGRVDEQVAAVNAVLPHLARLQNPIERSAWIGRLADALHIDDDLIRQQLRTVARAGGPTIRQRPGKSRAPLRAAETRLVYLLLRSSEERREWAGRAELAELRGSAIEPIVRAIVTLEGAGGPVDAPRVLAALETEDDQQLFTHLAFRDEPEAGPTVEDCLCAFRRDNLREAERRAVREMARIAPQDVDAHLRELQELAQRRDALP